MDDAIREQKELCGWDGKLPTPEELYTYDAWARQLSPHHVITAVRPPSIPRFTAAHSLVNPLETMWTSLSEAIWIVETLSSDEVITSLICYCDVSCMIRSLLDG